MKCCVQFRQLFVLYSRLVTTVEYTDEVMRIMNESLEDSLVVMDTKLANYSSVKLCITLCIHVVGVC